MKILWCLLGSLGALSSLANDLRITRFSSDGTLVVTNTFLAGVVTVEKAVDVTGPWTAEKNVFSTGHVAQAALDTTSDDVAFFRTLAVDLTGPDGFTNLTQSYNVLTTVAGSGNIQCISCNSWQSDYEGGFATDAALSSPHIAMADRAGNIYIADKRAHGIRKVTTDGIIHTVAGINVAGYGSISPTPAVEVALNNPNGIWVRADGTFYILDRDNGLIRKVDTNGMATLMVNHGSPIPGGRGLWVKDDESILYYSAQSQLMVWDSTNGLAVLATGFSDLSNMAMDPQGRLVVTDRLQNRVYRMESDGSRTTIAGNGGTGGGGDGQLATDTGLYQVRGICFLPTGGYLLATDAGCQVWYVDTDGYIHLFLNGSGNQHSGDGSWFYDDPSLLKISAGKEVTMDYEGNLLVTESESGYIRKIQFQRHGP